LRAVCKATSVKAPGSGGFTEVALHAALSLAQHHSAWWPENAWLTSSCNVRNPENNSLSGAEFCSLNERFSMRLWRAKRRQTANTQIAPNSLAQTPVFNIHNKCTNQNQNQTSAPNCYQIAIKFKKLTGIEHKLGKNCYNVNNKLTKV
jgi:hypothetical protein